ncbi:MAG: hypothetical protein HQL09_00390 [Nitrospirae bacterium]|nr:hypothetical protein [Nitrospirota bacterium]
MMINSQIFYNQFLSGLQQNMQAELTDADQLSSGKKINQPSDDPSGLWKVVDYQTQLSQIGQYQNAMSTANTSLQSLDSSLSDLSTTLNSANQVAISSGDGAMNANDRLDMAKQVQQLFESAVSTANTQVEGRYIFGGYQSNVNPINPATGEFVSDTNTFNIGISNGINVTANVSAGSLFSFKRVSTTDSATAILPTYNWTNNGANTIPDADPTSALYTSQPSQPLFTVNQGDSIVVGKAGVFTTYNLTPGDYTGTRLAAQLNTDTNGSLSFSYNTNTNNFTVNKTVNGDSINWSSGRTSDDVRDMLGFQSSAVQNIGSGITSDFTVNRFTQSGNTFTQDGGQLNIQVNSSSSTSSVGGFLINNTNDTLTVDGTQLTPATDKSYAGSDLSSALSGLTGNLKLAFSYDSTAHKFTITNNDSSSHAINFSESPQLAKMLGFSPATDKTISAGQSITSDTVVGDVNIAENASLQGVRDAINTANAGVKAEVVNIGTSVTPDYRLVVASDPAGSSDKIDITVKPDSAYGIDNGRNNIFFRDKTTGGTYTASIQPGTYTSLSDPATGLAAAVQKALNKATYSGLSAQTAPASLTITAGAGGNDTIYFNDGNVNFNGGNGNNVTAQIAPAGTYTSASALAAAVQTAMNNAEGAATGVAGTYYTVDATTVPGQLTIKNTTGFNVTMNPAGNLIDDATAKLGFTAGSTVYSPYISAQTVPASLTITGANDTMYFNDGNGHNNVQATIVDKTYTSAGALAAAVQTAMNNAEGAATGIAGTYYTVDATTVPGQLTIKNTTGSNVTMDPAGNPGDNATVGLGFMAGSTVCSPANLGGTKDHLGNQFNNPFSVSANSDNTLTIKNGNANDEMDVLWNNSGTTLNPAKLGFPDGPNALTAGGGTATSTSFVSLTGDPSGTGINMLSYDPNTNSLNMTLGTNITNYNYITQASANDSIVIDDGTNGGVANNQIIVNVGGTQETATIARGTYTHDQLAAAVATALDNAAAAAGKTDTYNVSYDRNADKFTIAYNARNTDTLTLNWSNDAGSTARQVLGFNATDETPAFNIDKGNNAISFNVGANSYKATIAIGAYTTGAALATAITSAMTAQAGANAPVVNYSTLTNEFVIQNNTASAVTLNWGSSTMTPQQIGFTATQTNISATNPGVLSAAGLPGATTTAGTLSAATVPTTYNITAALGNNKIIFADGQGHNVTATIADNAAYTIGTLATEVQTEMNAAENTKLGTAGITYYKADDTTVPGKITITNLTGFGATLNQAGDTASAVLGYTAGSGYAVPAAVFDITAAQGNNKIVFADGLGHNVTATIADNAAYTVAGLATAVQNAMNAAENTKLGTVGKTYYQADATTVPGQITITNLTGSAVTLNQTGDTASTGLGLTSYVVPANSGALTGAVASAPTDQSDNAVLANYYSFNNNYLNDKYILRALNFEKISLQNNDNGRVSQSLKYIGDLTEAVSQSQATVGSREGQITAQGNYMSTSKTEIQTFMSNIQDTDIAKVSADLAQRQAALQALSMVTSQVLNQSLFDFLKF